MLLIWLRVPVPVVPINFSAVPLSLFLYITIYILVSYKYYRRDVCPSIFNWNNWNWNSFSSEPDGRSQILPLPGSPNDILVSSLGGQSPLRYRGRCALIVQFPPNAMKNIEGKIPKMFGVSLVSS
jgi:hypothetical protein